MRDIIIHGELYPQYTKMRARFKVAWNGFDNSSGNFNIYFQGFYKIDGTAHWGTPLGSSATGKADIHGLVLSSSSGEYIYDFIFNSEPYTAYEGIRSNYSIGTGTLKFSDFIVIPEKYYVPENSGGTHIFISEKIIFHREKLSKSKSPKGGDLEWNT